MISPIFAQIFSLSLLAALAILGGCTVLDPDGEWRGTPEARARSYRSLQASGELPLPSALPKAVSTLPMVTQGPGAHGRTASEINVEPLASEQGNPVAEFSSANRALSSEERMPEVERAYVAGRYRDAEVVVEEILKSDPGNSAAWLRRGNLHHQGGRLELAAESYRRALGIASSASPSQLEGDARLVEVKAKASANLALLGIEQTRNALETLDASQLDPTARAHRKRIETALHAVISNSGLGAKVSGSDEVAAAPPTPSREWPGSPTGKAIQAKPEVELIRGLVSR